MFSIKIYGILPYMGMGMGILPYYYLVAHPTNRKWLSSPQ